MQPGRSPGFLASLCGEEAALLTALTASLVSENKTRLMKTRRLPCARSDTSPQTLPRTLIWRQGGRCSWRIGALRLKRPTVRGGYEPVLSREKERGPPPPADRGHRRSDVLHFSPEASVPRPEEDVSLGQMSAEVTGCLILIRHTWQCDPAAEGL